MRSISTPFLAHATHGGDELHREALGRQGRSLGADAKPGSVAGGACPRRRAFRSTNARSTGTTSAAVSAAAAARRTTSTRPSRSPSSFPDVPIKMIWSREEDQAHDFYRPISQCKLSAGLDAERQSRRPARSRLRPVDQCHAQSEGHRRRQGHRQLQGYYATPGDAQLGYAVPNLLIEYAMRNTHVPVGPWRGVNTNQNGVYMECFMDEVAKAAGKDPLEFRRALMKDFRSISPCSMPRPRRAIGASRCRRACIAASRSSWAMAATRRPSPKSRSARRAS